MITEDIIKETYIQRIVKRDRNIINNVQRRVVRKYFYDTGTLYNFLTSRPFSMKGTVFWFRILPYLRFLDIKYSYEMKARREMALYNRVIWGVLYNETIPDIRYGYTQDIRKHIIELLRRGMEIEKNDYPHVVRLYVLDLKSVL